MTVFFILAACLVVAALVAIIPSALKSSPGTELDQLETNIKIAKERRAILQRSLADNTIDQATYDIELSDLENALALDLSAEKQGRKSSRSGVAIAIGIALFIPIASGALYLHLGMPTGVDSVAAHEQSVAEQAQKANTPPPALAELLPNLEKKLEANPDDRDGWKLLGKSYLTISEFSKAKDALLRAYELDAKDPDLLAQLAEATAMELDGDLSGQANDYLDSALAINPNHQQSLWLKAIASQQAGNHEDAISRFEVLRTGVSGNADAIASIDQMIGRSVQALGGPVEPTVQAQSPSQPQGASLTVTVTVPADIISQVAATDSVFIFARASSGPPMPLAVSRHVVSELPVTVVLDDSMAMMPAMTLSQFPSVTVGARISQSGNAIAQPGDWYGEQENVTPAEVSELTVIIDQQK